jgi:hypothetical protein
LNKLPVLRYLLLDILPPAQRDDPSREFIDLNEKIYEEYNKAALGRLEEQATFKSRPLWGVKAGKGLNCVI